MTSVKPFTARPGAARSGAARGVLWMLLTTFCFICMDTLAKHLGQSYPVPQVVWARYVFQVLILVLFLGPRLPRALRSRRLGMQVGRSLFLLGATVLYFTALGFIQLAEASAIMFVAPLIVTALAVPLLGERVGPRRWASVLVGFLGALIIIRPGGGAMQATALFALGAAGCYALYQITTRMLAGQDPPLTTLAYSAGAGTLATSLAVPFFWIAPDAAGWLAMTATVSPFGYSALIWATLFGFAAFGDLPDLWTVVGALVIAGSGLYIVHRERVKRGISGPG